MKKTISQKIKTRARRTLKREVSKLSKNYVIDTSSVINKVLFPLLKKGLKGKLIIPHAVMAELESMANKGRPEGFTGLEEIAKFHNQKQLKVFFEGARPNEMQIRFAKSGEIDALIRQTAIKNKATIITSDLVQAKSSQAYGLEVIFIKVKSKPEKKKKFLFWRR